MSYKQQLWHRRHARCTHWYTKQVPTLGCSGPLNNKGWWVVMLFWVFLYEKTSKHNKYWMCTKCFPLIIIEATPFSLRTTVDGKHPAPIPFFGGIKKRFRASELVQGFFHQPYFQFLEKLFTWNTQIFRKDRRLVERQETPTQLTH